MVKNNVQSRDWESKDSCNILINPKEMTNLTLARKIEIILNIIKILKFSGIVAVKNYLIDYVKYKGEYVL